MPFVRSVVTLEKAAVCSISHALCFGLSMSVEACANAETVLAQPISRKLTKCESPRIEEDEHLCPGKPAIVAPGRILRCSSTRNCIPALCAKQGLQPAI